MTKKDLAGVMSIFMCCVGSVIGAGFASGQEIMSFFVRYGKNGAMGIALCGVLFSAYVYTVLKKIYVSDIDDFRGYFSDVAGRGTVSVIEMISYGFMLASFCVMVSGSGAVAEQFSVNKIYGILFMAGLCFFVFLKGVDGMVAVNAVMTPLIIIGIFVVGIMSTFESPGAFAGGGKIKITDNFLSSAIMYVSYNTVTLIGVLLPLKNKVTSRSVAVFSGISSGIFLAVMGLVLWLVLWRGRYHLEGIEVPMLFLARQSGEFARYMYGAVLYMAMITTAVSSGFVFLTFLKERFSVKNSTAAAGMCAFSVPFSLLGFANLVDKLYRLFGILGIFVLIMVFFGGARKKCLKSLC